MEVMDAIRSRRSVRTYNNRKIERVALERIIEAGTWAPTACNRQGFRFIIVTEPSLKKRLVDNGAASFVANAPAGILVLYDNRTDNLEYSDHIQSAAAAIQNMLLAAHSMKIGGCWVCHLPRKDSLRTIFGISKHLEPIAYLTLGYYDVAPKPSKRKTFDEVVSFDTAPLKDDAKVNLGILAKRKARGVYVRLPNKAKKALSPIASKFEKKFEGT